MALIAPDLVRRWKRLRGGGRLPTGRDRAPAARQGTLRPLEFPALCLPDEIDRRDSHGLATRLAAAGFEEIVSLEHVTWETPVAFDRPRVRELYGLVWLREHENISFCGPVGVGKTYLACALGHSACRAGARVRFVKGARLLQSLHHQ